MHIPLHFFSTDKQHEVKDNLNKLRSKKKIMSILSDLKLSSSGNLMDCKKRLIAHQNCIQQMYSEKKWNQSSLNFENERDQLTFVSPAFVDENLIYAAYASRRTIEMLVTFKDSVGVQASVATLLIYAKIHGNTFHRFFWQIMSLSSSMIKVHNCDSCFPRNCYEYVSLIRIPLQAWNFCDS